MGQERKKNYITGVKNYITGVPLECSGTIPRLFCGTCGAPRVLEYFWRALAGLAVYAAQALVVVAW